MSNNGNWQQFMALCEKAGHDNKLPGIFDFFFTPEEKQHLANRVQLTRELLKGEKTQRAIAKDCNISIAKITRGSNMLKSIPDDLRAYLQACLS